MQQKLHPTELLSVELWVHILKFLDAKALGKAERIAKFFLGIIARFNLWQEKKPEAINFFDNINPNTYQMIYEQFIRLNCPKPATHNPHSGRVLPRIIPEELRLQVLKDKAEGCIYNKEDPNFEVWKPSIIEEVKKISENSLAKPLFLTLAKVKKRALEIYETELEPETKKMKK